MITSATTSILLLLVIATAVGDKYTFLFDEPVAYMETDQGRRYMQDVVGQPDCYLSGTRFICDLSTTVRADDGNETIIGANVDCEFTPLVQTDIRKGQGCFCTGKVTNSAGERPCPCSLCPAGKGNNPVSIDCDYVNRTEDVSPIIIDNCTSFDCDFNCNGECDFTCTPPVREECYYICGTPEPTAAPSTPSAGKRMTTFLTSLASSILAITLS